MVVVYAQEEARSLGHRHIGTEHLLLALLRDEREIPAATLASRGVTLDLARERVVAIAGRSTELPSGQIPFTPRAKKVLERALREALSLGVDHIATEHLMLGLLRDADGIGAQVLADLGALEELRADLIGAAGAPHPARWHRATVMWRPEGLELRAAIDGALERVSGSSDERSRAEEFLRVLRGG